jgi:CDP-diacylglycerol--glycerol-3-phosphate 3-phosphatidyltransferase
VEHQLEKNAPLTLTEKLRLIFKLPLERAGKFLASRGVKPNIITFVGLLGTILGSVFIANGNLPLGGGIILLMGPIDALDGAVARAGGSISLFGAFLDSVTDRYIEAFIYGSLIIYFLSRDESLGVLLSFISLVGSVLVSYTRARAEGLGFQTKVGVLTRFERMLVIGPTVLFKVPMVGVGIVAVLANLTAFQRIIDIKRKSDF